jgi:hypothetical protein
MAGGEGAWVGPMMYYSLMWSSLCNLDGTRDPLYSLAAMRSVQEGQQ